MTELYVPAVNAKCHLPCLLSLQSHNLTVESDAEEATKISESAT